MDEQTSKRELRLGATPTAKAEIASLEKKDARAGKKVRGLLKDLQALRPVATNKSIMELRNSRNPMHQKLAKQLSELGFGDKARVATDDLNGPSAQTPPSIAYVLYSDDVSTPGVDRAIIGAGLLVRGEQLLPLDDPPQG